MYFLRRRHGRKPQPDSARAQQEQAPRAPAESAEPDEPRPAKTVVITKARRPRVDLKGEDDCQPAGTFRSGTLHAVARMHAAEVHHGKL